jgi:3',5'-nucleoside bisphosphate phosphatase
MLSADLHTHSNRSDGVLSPAALVREAHAAGLGCLAVTDHDSVTGIAEAEQAAAELGLQVVAGVELSVRDIAPITGQRVEEHLLGFFVDPTASGLIEYLTRLQEARRSMAQQTIEALARLGVPVDAERVAALAKGAVVTRPHIARALVEAGHVATEQEAFDRYLGAGRPGAPERPAPDMATGIAAIRAAGGVAGLAHPAFSQEPSWPTRLEGLPPRLDRMQAAGLVAVECLYPDATPEISARLMDLARARGLIVTGGTDFHGPGKAPFAPLGQVSVGWDVVDALRAARLPAELDRA